MTADAIVAATVPSVLPTLMVLLGILTNKNDINHVRIEISGLRGEISSVRSELHNSVAGLRSEMNAMRGEIHADINGLRTDIRMLTGANKELDKRVSRLEGKG